MYSREYKEGKGENMRERYDRDRTLGEQKVLDYIVSRPSYAALHGSTTETSDAETAIIGELAQPNEAELEEQPQAQSAAIQEAREAVDTATSGEDAALARYLDSKVDI